jgi:hypothetical protein
MGIENEVKQLLEEIKVATPGVGALEKLRKLREEYDWAIPGYRNSLHILSDTTYENRKHFLLELIQNADDATFLTENAELTFSIFSDGIELKYNEIGFKTEDVIAITDTGASTKVGKTRNSNSFIGEKGIGFKSVFALAEEVEIESPPWHFTLKKDECIIPKDITSKFSINEGTRLKIKFKNSETVNLIYDELKKFVCEEMESFLFLQRLSSFKLVDKRSNNERLNKLVVGARDGECIILRALPENIMKEYVLYSEEIEFPEKLVKERWEKYSQNSEAIKRKFSVAALADDENKGNRTGKLFCFLPTQVKLPIPVYIQVDGHLKADREKLHDPQNNNWNIYLFNKLPDFLSRAILSWRYNEFIDKNLIEYVPNDAGSDQLQPVFKNLINNLKDQSWVLCFDEKDWESPSKVVIANKFLTRLFEKYPDYRLKVEKYLGKKFVCNKWLSKERWRKKLKDYEIKELDELTCSNILSSVELPRDVLYNEENLINLYEYISSMDALKKNTYLRAFIEAANNIKENIMKAHVFPIEGIGFAPLIYTNSEPRVFWIDSASKRETGTSIDAGLDYRVVNTEYTYRAESGGTASQEAKERAKRINRRNDLVKDLLRAFEISPLKDETLLTELQIPALLKEIKDIVSLKGKLKILKAIFKGYRAKRNYDDDYLKTIRKIGKAKLLSVAGTACELENLTLPSELKFEDIDFLFDESNFKEMFINAEFLKNDQTINMTESMDRNISYWKDLRGFLISCGIKVYPSFNEVIKSYKNSFEFKDENEYRYKQWYKKIDGDFTECRKIEVSHYVLDDYFLKVLRKKKGNFKSLSNILYKVWEKQFKNSSILLNHVSSKYILYNSPGYYLVKYKRNSEKTILLIDNKWGGAEKEYIPVAAIGGRVAYANECYKIPSSAKLGLKKIYEYLPIVCEGIDEQGQYDSGYIESLAINQLSLSDINLLWNTLPIDKYDEIIECALELLKAGFIDDGLKLYDKKKGVLKQAKDFKLGSSISEKTPMIEEQYGSLGRLLGEKIGLKQESNLSAYKEFLNTILKPKARISIEDEKLIRKLLKDWKGLDVYTKREIYINFNNILKLYGINAPYLVFNKEHLKLLNNINESSISIFCSENELYEMEVAAEDIGFQLISNAGELKVENESSLNEQEKDVIKQLLIEYINNLEKQEYSRFALQLHEFGDPDTWTNKIVRASRIYKSFGSSEESVINITLPYLYNKGEVIKFIVAKQDSTEVIIARLLSQFGFERYKSALSELHVIKGEIKRKTEVLKTDPNSDTGRLINKDRVAAKKDVEDEIKGALIDRRPVGIDQQTPIWNTGLTPEEEESIRTSIGSKLLDTLSSAPILKEKIKRHIKKEDKDYVMVNPDQINPGEFFEREYNKSCQICGTRLSLHNGGKWIETFHIRENKQQLFWTDYPFNILGLCPNCHTLAKHGGGRDFSSIFEIAKLVLSGDIFAVEVQEYNGDYYRVPIKLNGVEQNITISKIHMGYFTALVENGEEEIASGNEIIE